MKYIKKFADHSLYEKYTLNKQNTPNISKCVLQNEIHYNSRLPYDAEIEYLQSSGTQHILTNLYGDNDLGFESKFKLDSTSSPEDSNSASIFGSRIGATYYNYQLSTWRNGTFGYGNQLNNELSFHNINTEYIVKFSDNKIYVNNSLIKTVTINTFKTPSPLYIFALSNNTSIAEHFIGKIYYIKFFNRTTLKPIADLIPVRVGQIGYMYDKVSKQLFGNSGTGDFTLGPDK